MTDITVPQLGESVTEATVGQWLKAAGDTVAKDEILVELETDKVSIEVSAPEDGTLSEIAAAEGVTVEIGALLGRVSAGGASTAPAPAAETAAASAPAAPAAPAHAAPDSTPVAGSLDLSGFVLSPVVRRLINENNIDPASVTGTGVGGRITRKDVEAVINAHTQFDQLNCEVADYAASKAKHDAAKRSY